MKSCLYECVVSHHRLEPKEHRFRYRLFYLSLDLDELDALAVPGLSHNRWNVYSFRDRDHLTLPGGEQVSVRENLRAWLAPRGITLPAGGRIQLVTLPRVLGYVFNPVSFYFCSAADGAPLCAVVEVGNTFREMKPYLLTAPGPEGSYRCVTPKHFYVSPFSELDLCFDFHLQLPARTLNIRIDESSAGRTVMRTALTGRQVALTGRRLFWFSLKYPLLTLQVITAIHWQALRLWLRRLPWQRKAANPQLQRDFFPAPHALAPADHE